MNPRVLAVVIRKIKRFHFSKERLIGKKGKKSDEETLKISGQKQQNKLKKIKKKMI